MKTNKKIIFIISLLVILIVSATTYTFASGNDKYFEPEKKPAGLPVSAKFNPETGYYYDSEYFEWDSNTHVYQNKPEQIPEDFRPPKVATMTIEEWININRNSSDETVMALVKYAEAMIEFYNNHPELMASSRWEVGQDGGPLTILTDLDVEGLPELLKYVNWEEPLVVPVMIAIEKICKTEIAAIYPDDIGVANWKNAFSEKASSTKYAVDDLVKVMAAGAINDAEINERLSALGIFALPAVYDEIINKSNTGLEKYAGNVIPDKKLTEFNIKGDSSNSDVLRQILEKCQKEAEIIKNLSVE